MKRKDFYFNLPPDRIAQHPILNRDNSKLLVLNRKTGEITHLKFFDVIDLLNANDCVVLNNSKVFPARVYGVNEKTKAKLEFLLLDEIEKNFWNVLAKPAKRARVGEIFSFSPRLKAKVINVFEYGKRVLQFFYDGDFYEILNEIGQIPLPPYIKEKLDDFNRYQTVYSKEIGSCAAPTAGLHFTENMLEKLKNKGVKIAFLTLHVGLGTFLPVKEEDIENHKMHSEKYFLKQEDAKKINDAKNSGNKIYCVGTTSCRAIESIFEKNKKICKDSGSTDIFIYPGFKFNVMDALITNFHLPESTLLMLVSAFGGYHNIMKAYETAIKKDYRFFSFGDAMLIV